MNSLQKEKIEWLWGSLTFFLGVSFLVSLVSVYHQVAFFDYLMGLLAALGITILFFLFGYFGGGRR